MLDRLALLSDEFLYFLCDENYRVLYHNKMFENTIVGGLNSDVIDFLHQDDTHTFLKSIEKKKNNFSVRVKVKGHKYELCKFTFDTLFNQHLHFLGIIKEDTPQQDREERKRLKNALVSVKDYINHKLLAQQARVEGGLQLMNMAKTDDERKAAYLMIQNASKELRIALNNANFDL
jgi:hypothetical protein